MIIKTKQCKVFLEGCERLKNTDLPLKTAYSLVRAAEEVQKFVDFYGEKFQQIIDKYAKKDENGEYMYDDANAQYIQVKEGCQEQCEAEIAELLELETEINVKPISLEDFGSVSIDPETLGYILPIIVYEEDK